MALLFAASFAAAGELHRDVFVSGADDYHTFRIPSLIVSATGTLLALAEGRKSARHDTGDIDLVLRRSTDGGKTWGPLQIVWDDGLNTVGNPCPVVDRKTGTIWLPITRNLGVDKQTEIVAGTSKGTREAWITKSTDDGLTWSKPINITSQVKAANWRWFATGPGVGIQMKSGRLVIPCDYTIAGKTTEYAFVMYSDDGGKTWQSGGSTTENCGEAQVVELRDGSLLMNMRHVGGGKNRRTAVSRDDGLTWGEVFDNLALVDPGCQGSIVKPTRVAGGASHRLFFVNPASLKREQLRLRFSDDDGKTWSAGHVLHAGPAAYSCATVLPDGSVGVMFECGEKGAYERLRFVAVPASQVTARP